MFLYCLNSTLTLSMRGEDSVNINFMIALKRHGIRHHALPSRVVSLKWTVISRTRVGSSWDFSRSPTTTSGWNSCSNIKAFVSGQMKNTSSCRRSAKCGLATAPQLDKRTKKATNYSLIPNPCQRPASDWASTLTRAASTIIRGIWTLQPS